MLKKILILPVGFLITTFLYISCCKCLDPKGDFYEVARASVRPEGSGGVLVDNGMPVTADTVFLNYYLTVNCVAQIKPAFSFLINSAYACSCGCGEQGLKSKLLSIELTSDNVFNGIAANTSLNSLFKVKGDVSNAPDFSIDSLVTLFNGNDGIRPGFDLFTKSKPGNTLNHKFTLNMVYANNTVVTVVSNPIKWQ
jgi:hypothetical protein